MVSYPGGEAINHASDVNAVGFLELLEVGLRPIRIGLLCVSSAVSAGCFEYRILGVSDDNTSKDI